MGNCLRMGILKMYINYAGKHGGNAAKNPVFRRYVIRVIEIFKLNV
jgi:hypothetical protein